MAGILDKKERMIDFIITDQGRKQISDGRLIIEYASFTDMHTFYEMSGSDHPDVAEDASNRLFFEATDRHQDIIVPEIRAGSSMQSFRALEFNVEGRRIAEGTFSIGQAVVESNALTGSDVNKKEIPFLNALVTNFRDHRILETEDLFSDTSDFALTAHTASFVLTNNNLDFGPVGHSSTASPARKIYLSSWPSIYRSDRFDHLCNFRFMPPINVKEKTTDSNVPLGLYPNFDADKLKPVFQGVSPTGEFVYHPAPTENVYKISTGSASAVTDTYSVGGSGGFTGFSGELGSSAQMGRFASRGALHDYLSGKQNLSFTFKDTSNDNNFISQIFEINAPENESIEKLSIIDFGEFNDDDPESPGYHVYFVGRLRKDELGAQTWLNLFTVVVD